MGSPSGITSRRSAVTYDGVVRVITFKVRPEMQKAIRHQAVEEDLDVSELIRRAVSRYLAAAQQQQT
ncbi:ribbon-helix-helix protein, CopG family [Paraburkholderia caledonica]|uniref:ribbon-helix-helix protein, CopG family n=1 Tax=Paraburkholderia caledonica TaxID=134536 RepID=UPI00047F9BD4|nr:ribbon-helix-helix protein, CopG family [Paraburkholderia caledonica]